MSLVALGDSITVGPEDGPSWAALLAAELGMPCTILARNGAVVGDVLHDQLPRAAGGHDVACLYAGVNDARSPAFDPAAYERDLRAVAQELRGRAGRLLLLTLPLDLGRPPAAPKPAIANEAVRRVAAEAGAALCMLDDFAGPAFLEPDAVHPTPAGQAEIAARAARALKRA